MPQGFSGNLIFAIIARMLSGNHLNDLVMSKEQIFLKNCYLFYRLSYLYRRCLEKWDVWSRNTELMSVFPYHNSRSMEKYYSSRRWDTEEVVHSIQNEKTRWQTLDTFREENRVRTLSLSQNILVPVNIWELCTYHK